MSDNSCQNCQVAYGPDDMFCENCGYDFITGSLPVDASLAPAPSSAGVAPVPGPPPASGKPAAGSSSSGKPEAGSSGAELPVAPSVLNAEGGLNSDGADAGDKAEASSGTANPESEAEAGGGHGLSGDVPRLTIVISVDREYFDAVVNDGEIDFPDPVPADQELELAGSELHIGRTSDSRAIHPDIDVAAITGDQAVSSRHAVLRVANDGSYTIVDVGSTNGTFLDSVDSEAITHGVPIEVKPGQALYVGAWTKLSILD